MGIDKIIIIIMTIFMAIGGIDKIFGNKLGYGEKVEEGVEIHEKETIKWREEDGTSQLPTYKEMIDRIYGQSHLETKKHLEKQGFEFTDNPNE